jgi:hypothetical protein
VNQWLKLRNREAVLKSGGYGPVSSARRPDEVVSGRRLRSRVVPAVGRPWIARSTIEFVGSDDAATAAGSYADALTAHFASLRKGESGLPWDDRASLRRAFEATAKADLTVEPPGAQPAYASRWSPRKRRQR